MTRLTTCSTSSTTRGTITLDDGTHLTIPPTVNFERMAVKPGATVKASYEVKDGKKVVTRIQVAK